MFIEDVIRQFEVLICFWCVLSIYILMMIILSNIKFCFWFSNVLDTVDSTSCNVYHQFNLTVKFMENMFFVPHCFKKVARVESVYSISFTVLRKVSGKPIFFFLSCLYKFPSTIYLHPCRSLWFLFLLKVKIGSSWNTTLNSCFLWNKFQLLLIFIFTFGHVRLYFNPSALPKKCPNTEFFLVRIFPYSVRIWIRFTQWWYFITLFLCFLFEWLLSVQSINSSYTLLSWNSLFVEQIQPKNNTCAKCYASF